MLILIENTINQNFLLLFCFVFIPSFHAQIVLNTNWLGNTYEKINLFFALEFTATEAPVQLPENTHATFERYINEAFDVTAKKFIFRFFSYIMQDSDVSINSADSQRTEIK